MLSNITLRTHIAVLLVLFLLFSVVAAVVGVMGFGSALTDLQSIASQDAAVRAAILSAEQRYSSALWVVVVCVLITVILAVWTYVVINGRLLNPLTFLTSHFNAIAKGDLSQRIVVKSKDEVGRVFEALQVMQANLLRTFGTVYTGVSKIHHDSDEIASGNMSLGSRIEQQAAALQQTAASMEQLAGTVRQNADNAHQANQLAATASTVAQRGGEAVGEVVNTMHAISASSSRIADIVGVIDSIAFQTNILALNAAVEAARAGEQGRGFAVVASEVRALAQRSAQAAREITTLIDDSVTKVNEGSGQVERAGATMLEIVDSVKRVTDIMGEISAATIEQSSGIDQVNLAVSQLDATTLQNAQMAETSVKLAHSMTDALEALENALGVYRGISDSHVIDMGAARQPAAPQVTAKKTALSQSTLAQSGIRKTALQTAARSAFTKPTAMSKQKISEIPGMKMKSAPSKDEPLLRPDLSSKKSTSAEDEWVEF